jgi:hypothetical protein
MRIRVLAGVIVALLAATPAAEARFRLVARAAGPAYTDGERFAAYQTTSGRTRLVDTRTGHARRIHDPSCGPSRTAGLASLRGGLLMWTCDDRAWIAGVRAGQPREIVYPRGACGGGAEYVYLAGVGARWLAVAVSGYHFSFTCYVNRRTGVARRESYAATLLPDLDLPGLERRLCRPLRRQPSDDFFDPGFAGMTYSRPWALQSRARGRSFDLVLGHCGTARVRTLVDCGSDCFGEQPRMSAGIVTWRDNARVRILRLGERRIRSVDEPTSTQSPYALEHTRRRLFLTLPGRGLTTRIYESPLPQE